MLSPILREKILAFKASQELLTIINNSNNEIYVTQLMKAISLGLKTNIAQRASNHALLQSKIQMEINPTKLFLEAESAYGLKYFTESLLLNRLQNLIKDIEVIEDLIHKEVNPEEGQ